MCGGGGYMLCVWRGGVHVVLFFVSRHCSGSGLFVADTNTHKYIDTYMCVWGGGVHVMCVEGGCTCCSFLRE